MPTMFIHENLSYQGHFQNLRVANSVGFDLFFTTETRKHGENL